MQWLDAKPIPGHEQAVTPTVVHHEGKHAAQVVHTILAPVLPGTDDGFGVAFGAEDVAMAPQFVHQLKIVVDLAIEDERHRLVVIEDRLLTRRNIDDRKASVAEANARLQVQITLVRTAVVL